MDFKEIVVRFDYISRTENQKFRWLKASTLYIVRYMYGAGLLSDGWQSGLT